MRFIPMMPKALWRSNSTPWCAGEACARSGEAIGLWEHLILARSELSSGGRHKPAILSGACEAIIAALYLDGGMAAARAFIDRYWDFRNFGSEIRDAKTRLQEWAQGRGKSSAAPVYNLIGREGPDHAPRFVVEATVTGFAPERGEGGSKREAEQDAAAKILVKLSPPEAS